MVLLGERLTVAALSGAIAQAAIYPLEVVQTRLAATHGVYQGIMDVAQTLWFKEGPRALYRWSFDMSHCHLTSDSTLGRGGFIEMEP